MKSLAVAVLLVVVACSSSQPVPNTSSSPAATTSASQTSISCRLPISVDLADGTGPHGKFVGFPSGLVTDDPQGDGGRYYDRRLARWLPVEASALSPDGSHYAFGGGTSDLKAILHIVDLTTGSDDIYPLPPELAIGLSGPEVIGYTGNAIYIGEPTEGGMSALWTFDVATHHPTFLNVMGFGVIDGTTVWRSTFDPADTSAWSWPGVSPGDQIEQFDLATHTHNLWLRSPGHFVNVIGVDAAHHPIVRNFSDRQTLEISVLSSPSAQLSIYQGSTDAWGGSIVGMSADSHGIWFGSDKGLYLFADAAGVRKVSDQVGVPAGTCA